MKLFFAIYDATYDEDVMEALNNSCVTGFTKWDRVHGKGANSDPRMDTAVWPGFNYAVAVVADDDNGDLLRGTLRSLAKRFHGTGIKIYEMPVSEVAI